MCMETTKRQQRQDERNNTVHTQRREKGRRRGGKAETRKQNQAKKSPPKSTCCCVFLLFSSFAGFLSSLRRRVVFFFLTPPLPFFSCGSFCPAFPNSSHAFARAFVLNSFCLASLDFRSVNPLGALTGAAFFPGLSPLPYPDSRSFSSPVSRRARHTRRARFRPPPPAQMRGCHACLLLPPCSSLTKQKEGKNICT